eukprot:scaffold10170_cov136-Isochrysis_galbana.AAC.5
MPPPPIDQSYPPGGPIAASARMRRSGGAQRSRAWACYFNRTFFYGCLRGGLGTREEETGGDRQPVDSG